MEKLTGIGALEAYRQSLEKDTNKSKTIVRICMTGCRAYGAEEVRDALMAELNSRGLSKIVEVRQTGCHGLCARAPVMSIDPLDIFYQQVNPEDALDIVRLTLEKGKVIPRLLYSQDGNGAGTPRRDEIPFYKGQTRQVLSNCGIIDPQNISHYILLGGYRALAKALSSMSPEDVINAVEASGLRGRGGAGFPTGRKWRIARASAGRIKYIICNADEGDPGAFMDRAVLEGDPHCVIEGMLIAAYAIGAQEGYIYVRAEYPIAVEHLNIAVEQAEAMGLLGARILGADFSFHLKIKEGAGAFVCGEETALIASIEGKRGMARPRPPFPAQSGLFDKPTNINNVETFANIKHIILNGPEWYARLGTDQSKGTKIFSLAGKVNNTGLVEVPIGITMRQVIFDIGGGIPKGRKFKAVQMGGPSGGCVPARYLDLPLDYGSLDAIGAIMGSGGMVVVDENTCMVEIARFFLSFTQSESCGKCAPCRLGTKQMLSILTRITQGKGEEKDIQRLISIAKTIKETSLCGLGQTCPNPVLSTLRYFRDEYEAHIKDKRCPAAVCDALIISPCQHACPAGVDVPNYVAYIADGKYFEAAELIREKNPFPAVCGRICHHPCELKCRRGELDDPVSIRALKRLAADWYFQNITDPPEPFPITKKEKIAVVGAGPTGLSCAYHLARMGYKITAFEALPVAGGMLGVAIPDFRMPKEILQKEIKYIEGRGVEIRYNSPITTNYSVERLKKEGYDAVFIAAGSQRSQTIGIPGEIEGIDGLYYGLRFLRDVKTGKRINLGKKVIIIGGGNTAIDSARTALRLGARKVDVLYRRTREEMPVTDVEFNGAAEEGVHFHFLVSPTRVVSENWKVKGVECIRMRLGEADETGRRRPLPLEGTEFFMTADSVIPAVGQAPDLSFLPPDSNLERVRWGALQVDPNNLSTNIQGIFAGGDFVTGPTTVIEAIAAGRRAAIAIDKYFKGDATRIILHETKELIEHEIKLGEEEEMGDRPRIKIESLSPKQRSRTFEEIELGYSEGKAREEAKRCMRCDLQ